jgi:hypothetical protein
MLLDDISDSDVEMHSARSELTSVPPGTNHQAPSINQNGIDQTNSSLHPPDDTGHEDDTLLLDEPPASPSLDLLSRVKGMYRLLDLLCEEGSGGIGM